MLQSIIKQNRSITLFLKLNGSACNMHCVYCYSHIKTNDVKTSCSVDDVISYLSSYRNYDHVFIVFHGGEPLLSETKTIKAVLDYISTNFNNKVHVQFQTNGSLINDEWLMLFHDYAHLISLSISLDPSDNMDLRIYPKGISRNDILSNIKKCSKIVKNIGVISVAHKCNDKHYLRFINELIENDVHCLTISKYQSIGDWKEDKFYLTENEYVEMLIRLSYEWVSKKLYTKIDIQPLHSLFSSNSNKLCIYMNDPLKCTYFHTFYSGSNQSDLCDHITDEKIPAFPIKCETCSILEKCGGGCIAEIKDDTFCVARHRLVKFIGEMKNGNNRVIC